MRFLIICSLLLTLAACSDGRIGGPDAPDAPQEEGIQSGPVRGTFFGTPWSFTQGRVEIRNSGGAQMYLVQLWEETFADPCDMFNSPSRSMLFLLPTTVGTYQLNNSRTVTFTGNGMNLVATDGVYKLSSVLPDPAPGLIQAALKVEFDAENTVNGTFEVAICN
jgi:hypothetical protein